MGQESDYRRYKTLLILLTVAVFAWGVVGTLDIKNIPYGGYILSPDRRVTQVLEGGPAAAAGLQVGDLATQIDGIAVENTAAFNDRGRPAINSDGSLTIVRGGTQQTVNFKYGVRPTTTILTTSGVLTLTGLGFLILGLLAYLKNPTRLGTTLCALGILFSAAVFNRPYFDSSTNRRIVGAIIVIASTLLMAVILDYCVSFPRTKDLIQRRQWLLRTIYRIAGALGIALATITLTTPMIDAHRAMIVSVTIGLFFGGYSLLAVVAVIHSYVKATSEQRSATGLNILAVGIIVGLGPLIVSIVARLIDSHMEGLPGEQYYPISYLALPIAMAMALMKLEGAAARVEAHATA